MQYFTHILCFPVYEYWPLLIQKYKDLYDYVCMTKSLHKNGIKIIVRACAGIHYIKLKNPGVPIVYIQFTHFAITHNCTNCPVALKLLLKSRICIIHKHKGNIGKTAEQHYP